ncbi:MAG: porin [Ignavibacteria bacterium]
MKKQFYLSAVLLLLVISTNYFAQEKPVTDLAPKFNGDVRTWYDNDFQKNKSNFTVKNARILVTGNASEIVSYKFLFDVAAVAGKLTLKTKDSTKYLTDAVADMPNLINDAYVTITPITKLAFSLGQFKTPFGTENITSTNSLAFSNRALMAGKVTPELYDIGFMTSYALPVSIPVDVIAAAYNGTGQNKTDDDRSTNYAFRTVVKPIPDLNISANYAGGRIAGNKVGILGLGAGYKCSALTLALEYADRKTDLATTINAVSYFAYATYDFATGNDIVRFITPAVRYESYDPDNKIDKNNINKITAGLTFSFAKLTYAHVRINYEKFDNADGTPNPDRMIAEFQIRF